MKLGEEDICLKKPCSNEGKCLRQIGLLYGFTCNCSKDWTGYTCDRRSYITLLVLLTFEALFS